MNYSKVIMLNLIVFLFLVIACAPRLAPEAVKSVPAPVKERLTAKEAWELDWERTLKAAQKEGTVVVYGGSSAVALKLQAVKLIKEKFGINLEISTLPEAEMYTRIRTERNAGIYAQDLHAAGVGNMFDRLKPWDAVEPMEPLLILPEVLDPKAWFGGELPWGDRERKVFVWAGHPSSQISVNSNIVQPEEIKSYYDLLDPRWKGKITIFDPTTGGGVGFNSFIVLIYNKLVDLDFFRQLLREQQPTVTRDPFLQIGWLARGKMPVALWPSTGRMAQYIKEGAPISNVFPKEGVHLSGGGGGLTLIKKAPHPNAAKIFLNWLLSKEGQLLIQNGTGKQSLRVDIPTDELGPGNRRIEGYKYLPDPNNLEEFVLKEYDRYLDMVKEVFGTYVGR